MYEPQFTDPAWSAAVMPPIGFMLPPVPIAAGPPFGEVLGFSSLLFPSFLFYADYAGYAGFLLSVIG